MLVCVKRIFVSTSVTRKYIPLIVLVIITCLKSRSWLHNFWLSFLLNNCQCIVIFKSITGSNKAPLLGYKLIIIPPFLIFGLSSKSGHPEIKCVHGPRHGVDECRLVLIRETVDFICVFFDFFSLLDHLAVRIVRLQFTLGTLSIVTLVFIHAAEVNALFVLESLYLQSFLDSIG